MYLRNLHSFVLELLIKSSSISFLLLSSVSVATSFTQQVKKRERKFPEEAKSISENVCFRGFG